MDMTSMSMILLVRQRSHKEGAVLSPYIHTSCLYRMMDDSISHHQMLHVRCADIETCIYTRKSSSYGITDSSLVRVDASNERPMMYIGK